MLGGVLRGHLLGHRVPLAMTLALTYRCNLRCRYCRIWEEASPADELTTAQVLGAIDELTAAGMCRLGLTGGEPLLRDDLQLIIAHARRRRLFVTVFTNGLLVERRLATLEGVDAVLLSVDGPKELHDAQRGDGSHAAVLRALEVLREARIPVWTNTVLTRHNLGVVDYILELVGRYDARAAFQPVFQHSYSVDAGEIAALRADDADWLAVVDQLLERKRAGAPLLSSRRFFELLRQPPRRCLAGQRYGAISPTGRVAPCPVLLQSPALPDGRALGFVEGFRRCADSLSCTGCPCIATVESDLLFSLDPQAIGNAGIELLRRAVQQLRRLPEAHR
jgi:MoaA/NifB/PqqE/SkfB family radical SAM enzyme